MKSEKLIVKDTSNIVCFFHIHTYDSLMGVEHYKYLSVDSFCTNYATKRVIIEKLFELTIEDSFSKIVNKLTIG